MATTTAAPASSMAPDQQALYTCMSCLVGFHSPLDQRTHYRSDLHRYNMKRQVAGLPPVREDVFQQKVQQRDTPLQDQQPVSAPSQRPKCTECAKSFASDNALASHLNSRRHKEAAAKAATSLDSPSISHHALASLTSSDALVFRLPAAPISPPSQLSPTSAAAIPEGTPNEATEGATPSDQDQASTVAGPSSLNQLHTAAPTSLLLAADASDAEVEAAIAARLASSVRIDPSKQCIFCRTSKASSLEDCLRHMQSQHGFFLPERPYLVDLPGLAQYLADKVTIGHLCLYCNGRGRSFHTAEAAQKHMLDKSHCKVAYEREEDRMELSDFYDFSSSYPDYRATGPESEMEEEDGADWEDVEAGSASAGEETEHEEEQDPVAYGDNGLRYGDSELELVLPSGARLGHRSLARYYRQTLFSTPASIGAGAAGGGAVARRLIDQGRDQGRNSGLIVKDRNGGEVKARNRGEAREAKRHIREFRDTQRREQFMTRVGFVHNSQKHFRDPLLQ